jgi:hypothetical protein
MDKKLIQQLLNDDDTRLEIAIAMGDAVAANDNNSLYDDLMFSALNELNDILVEGEMITIEVSDHMWVRGEYLKTNPDGRVQVKVADLNYPQKAFYEGKRVDLVAKGVAEETI